MKRRGNILIQVCLMAFCGWSDFACTSPTMQGQRVAVAHSKVDSSAEKNAEVSVYTDSFKDASSSPNTMPENQQSPQVDSQRQHEEAVSERSSVKEQKNEDQMKGQEHSTSTLVDSGGKDSEKRDIALAPIAISASLEDNTGKNYVFVTDNPDDSIRIACQSVRLEGGDLISQSPLKPLRIPCVLVKSDERKLAWTHMPLDAEHVSWQFTIRQCDQARVEGTNLFPQDVKQKFIVTPATYVVIPGDGADRCVDSRASLSVTIDSPGSAKKIVTSTLVVFNKGTSLWTSTVMPSAFIDHDTQKALVAVGSSVEAIYAFEPAGALDTPQIRCHGGAIEPLRATAVPYDFYKMACFLMDLDDQNLGKNAYQVDQNPEIPLDEAISWQVYVTNCEGIRLLGTYTDLSQPLILDSSNAAMVTGGSFLVVPATELGAPLSTLQKCAQSGNAAMTFLIKDRKKGTQMVVSGTLKKRS